MPIAAFIPAPLFQAVSKVNPKFALASLGGRFVMLLFLPGPSPERDAMLETLRVNIGLFRDDNALVFGVLPDADSFAMAQDSPNGGRWFFDPEGEIRRLYGAEDAEGAPSAEWVLIDPTLRTLAGGPGATLAEGLALLEGLGAAADHAGVPVTAPVLVVPRILEPEFCRELMAVYDQQGGTVSGVMRVQEGRTVSVVDSFKSRRDAYIPDGPLKAGLRARVAERLLPEIARAFQFRATYLERYIVACYDAEEGGYFRPHRDNTTPGTAHRKFAVSINLNAEEFEGGDLRFPEFGPRTYRPPTGGAVVFSCSLLHEATPVTRGRRYATLPFLYDDAGQRLRLANLHTFGPTPGDGEAADATASSGAE